MKAELQQIENLLSGMQPSQLPASLVGRIEAELASGVRRDPETAESSNVVPFPGRTAGMGAAPPRRQRRGRGWSWNWAAAAAVALLGALAAWMLPDHGAQVASAPRARATRGADFIPATAGSGLGEVRDEGVVWNRRGAPLRKVRVVYIDRVTLRNQRGELVEAARPRVEYVLVPERVD